MKSLSFVLLQRDTNVSHGFGNRKTLFTVFIIFFICHPDTLVLNCTNIVTAVLLLNLFP